LADLDALYRQAGELRQKIGHAAEIKPRHVFDLAQLVEALALELKQRADREVETEG
jgi:hypothetical protein